jgi:hypothetical protein
MVSFQGAKVRELHYTLKLPYVYYYITKLCRLNEEVIKIITMKMLAALKMAKPEAGLNRRRPS